MDTRIDGKFCAWYSTTDGGVWITDFSTPFGREVMTCLAWNEL